MTHSRLALELSVCGFVIQWQLVTSSREKLGAKGTAALTNYPSARARTSLYLNSFNPEHRTPHIAERFRLANICLGGLVPKRKAGRRPKPQVTAAYLDWKTGMRGVALFRKHISGWEKHNRYHRIGEQKELMDAIRSRFRRERGSDAPVPEAVVRP